MVSSADRGSTLGGSGVAGSSSGDGANVVWSTRLQPASASPASRAHAAFMFSLLQQATRQARCRRLARMHRMSAQTNQRIDGKRLWDSLMAMAQIGATPKGGVRRLTLTEVDQRGRERFRAECEAAGLTVRVDAIGNMFARRAGRDPNRLPVLFGSHLDSQPSGGKFDGALGVIAWLEVR